MSSAKQGGVVCVCCIAHYKEGDVLCNNLEHNFILHIIDEFIIFDGQKGSYRALSILKKFFLKKIPYRGFSILKKLKGKCVLFFRTHFPSDRSSKLGDYQYSNNQPQLQALPGAFHP